MASIRCPDSRPCRDNDNDRLPAVARRLGLAGTGALRDIQVETAPLDMLDAHLFTVTVPRDSWLRGIEILELRLPPPIVVTLIVRDGATVVPDRHTVVRAGPRHGPTNNRMRRRDKPIGAPLGTDVV